MIADTLHAIDQRYTTYAAVDLDAITHNVRALVNHVVGAEVIAVIKDDAYGHGAVPVAHAVLEAGATRLAVGRTDEGVQLRRAGVQVPVLNLCYSVPGEAETVVAHGITQAVGDLDALHALSMEAARQGRTATVHLKVDTGMGRFGLLPDEVIPFLQEAATLPHIDFEGIFTHFAIADAADKTHTRSQYAKFMRVLNATEQAGFHFRVRHACNSAATIDLPEMALDAVRPGIALYGLPPSPDVSTHLGLCPALELHSHVARLKTLPPGSGVGYGLTYRTRADQTIALVPVGYGDGYHRLLSNRGVVLIGGQRAPIVGRVCMDQFMVDATGITGIETGSPVVLIGEQGEGIIRPGELATLAETINYEIVTGISRRIPRVYLRGGSVVEVAQLS